MVQSSKKFIELQIINKPTIIKNNQILFSDFFFAMDFPKNNSPSPPPTKAPDKKSIPSF